MITVTIKRKHAADTSFDSRFDDALIRAIKEQCPDLKVKQVFDGHFFDQNGKEWNYDPSAYSRETFRQLQKGDIKEIRLDLQPIHSGRAPMQ